MWFPEDFLGAAECGEPCGECRLSVSRAMGVALWVLLFLQQNVMVGLLFALAQQVPTRRWAVRPRGEKPPDREGPPAVLTSEALGLTHIPRALKCEGKERLPCLLNE